MNRFFVLAFAFAVACGSNTDPANSACSPGKTEACACVGAGDSGAQTCDGDGKGWGMCECPSQGAAGASSGAAGASSLGNGGESSAAAGGSGGAASGPYGATCYLAEPIMAEEACAERDLDTYQSVAGGLCLSPCGSAAYDLSEGMWCCPKK